jgi:hypothetical protein
MRYRHPPAAVLLPAAARSAGSLARHRRRRLISASPLSLGFFKATHRSHTHTQDTRPRSLERVWQAHPSWPVVLGNYHIFLAPGFSVACVARKRARRGSVSIGGQQQRRPRRIDPSSATNNNKQADLRGSGYHTILPPMPNTPPYAHTHIHRPSTLTGSEATPRVRLFYAG